MSKKEVYRTEIAKKLKKLREERGFSPKEVAEGTEINYGTYRYYETKIVPPSANLFKIAKFLNVSLDYFTEGEDQISKDEPVALGSEHHGDELSIRSYDGFKPFDDDVGELTEEEILFLQTFRSLSEEDRTELARYLKTKKDKE